MSSAEFLLKLEEEALFARLGNIEFQLERYGSYSPNRILEISFTEIGKKAFEKYANQIKSNQRYVASMPNLKNQVFLIQRKRCIS